MARKYQLHGAFPSKAGDSAYEVALKNGFEGTEQEWLNSLVGPQGPQGLPGEDGASSCEKITELTTTEKVYSVALPVDGSQYSMLFLKGTIAAWVIADEAPYTKTTMLSGATMPGIKNIPYSINGNATTFTALFVNVGGNRYIPFVFTPNGNPGVNGGVTTYNPLNGDFELSEYITVTAWTSQAYLFMEGATFELWGVRK